MPDPAGAIERLRAVRPLTRLVAIRRTPVDRFLKGTRFWLMPSSGIAAALLLAPVTRALDAANDWHLLWFTPQGASSVMTSLSTAMFTFIVFVISSLLLVVQLASAQLTPRIIAIPFESGYIRRAITIFAFSFAYTVAVSGRIADRVPQLGVALSLSCCLFSIGLFFAFANRLAIDLRPVSILTKIGKSGIGILNDLYPTRLAPDLVEQPLPHPEPSRTAKIVSYEGESGTILGFSQDRILAAAIAADVIIEMVPQVGDFIAKGDPIFRVTLGRAEVADEDLRRCIEVGSERTLRQDPRFAFRIIVDIANKALSPAINDPTTAVLAIDQLHRLLLFVGRRRLDEGAVRDGSGTLRLVYGTPDWNDYVALAVSEIRHFGSGSIQVSRRLSALLTHLLQVLPAARGAPLSRELHLLRASIERAFPDAEDRVAAAIPDTQGTGGAEPVGSPSELETKEPPPGA